MEITSISGKKQGTTSIKYKKEAMKMNREWESTLKNCKYAKKMKSNGNWLSEANILGNSKPVWKLWKGTYYTVNEVHLK